MADVALRVVYGRQDERFRFWGGAILEVVGGGWGRAHGIQGAGGNTGDFVHHAGW